jgi:hypothetical protein
LFLFQLGQILRLHSRYALLKLADIVNLYRRRSFQTGKVQFELFVVRKEELGELLQWQTVSCGFVFHGTGLEGHGLLERGVDSHLVQTHVDVLRIDRTFLLAVPLIEDFVQVAPWRVHSSQLTSNIRDLCLVDLALERTLLREGVPRRRLTLTHRCQPVSQAGFYLFHHGGAPLNRLADLRVTLGSRLRKVGRRVRVIAGENLISPLILLQMVDSLLGDQYGLFRFLIHRLVQLVGGFSASKCLLMLLPISLSSGSLPHIISITD